MSPREVVTFWLDMGAPISLLSRVAGGAALADCRTAVKWRPTGARSSSLDCDRHLAELELHSDDCRGSWPDDDGQVLVAEPACDLPGIAAQLDRANSELGGVLEAPGVHLVRNVPGDEEREAGVRHRGVDTGHAPREG